MYLLWFLQSIVLVGMGKSCSPKPSDVLNNTCIESREKIPLYIGGMMAVTVGWDGSGCLIAAELALEHINNRNDILPEYDLKMYWNDTQCLASKPLRALYDQVVVSDKQKIVLLGPACSGGAELVSETSQYWNLITVLYSALSPSLADRIKYPYVYRTVPIASNSFISPMLWLIKNYGWRRVGSISQSAPSFAAAQQNFVQRASKVNVSVVAEVITDEVKNQVENLKRLDMRIIHLTVRETNARKIFCEGNKIGLSGPDIVWFLPAWYSEKWWLVKDKTVDCSVEEMAEIVETSLILGVDVAVISRRNKTTVAGIVSINTVTYFQTPQEFLDEIKKRLLWPQYRNYTINNYISYSYDAVWTIALMLNRSSKLLKERRFGKRLEDFSYTDDDMRNLFFEEMATTDFFGTSGGGEGISLPNVY
ncbi:Gamma-aminobutyric acid type B receptor subunit 1 [Holothuria leucospilota]|uniref:Gamma-aminobutyric acid type B receptor subunit 1 n=1 Tax=Holothuria leucospilota TaxID=206669 RepID=A0A9Q1HGR6_HOLLE|nr:Gamma-aminobutyric acid type B receptor subunit 1 [Holothuria leucospilota]